MKMRAIVCRSWGGPEVLELTEIDRPSPGLAEVLVRVHASGVNPADWKTRADGDAMVGDPGILGYDVSGVVAAVGPGVTIFKPGDRIFGMPLFPKPARAYAEYVVAPARHFTRTPASLDHVHAAALPLAGLTACQALTETANIQPGQRVLIHAAAGGVGHLAVQIAKARGAYVIGTASAAKHTFVRDLGADELIDYRSVDFTSVAKEIDVVLDTVGGDYSARSLEVLRPGGFLIALNGPVDPDLMALAASRGVNADFTLVEADYAGMKALAALVESSQLRVEIDSVFPLAEAAAAHIHGETGRTTGKIVLAVA